MENIKYKSKQRQYYANIMLLLDIGLLHDIVLGDSSKKNFFF